ncbi:hypothetical protein EVG20_g8058 [Dentipellis fragilis]|uniref:Uncharacterized protein n=1 Tax=Dentipellis fragilis TaxID=205917 RepID=A0A4Y9Y819_9AGAM|nr:hypothetical protein EVG20_g8058 [Dentipellis fragilis]
MSAVRSISHPRLDSIIASVLTKDDKHARSKEELHQNGGVLDTRLHQWDWELDYLHGRIFEWRANGSPDEDAYASFRSYLLTKISEHIVYELQMLNVIIAASQRAMCSADVPRQYAGHVRLFIERIAPGEITRRMYLEEWKGYTAAQTRGKHSAAQMHAMLESTRKELQNLRARSQEFRRIGRDLEQLVKGLQQMAEDGVELASAVTPAERTRRFGGSGLKAPVKRLAFKKPEVPSISQTRTRLPPLPQH